MGLTAVADDPDPAGLNVRAGPSAAAPVIGVLKLHSFARDAMGRDLLQAPRFAVIGSFRGWLLVDDFAYPDPPHDPLPAGPGWVHGSRVSLRSYDESAPTARLHAAKGGGDAGVVVGGLRFSVLGCDGRWVEVRERAGAASTARPLAGWLAAPDTCSEQMSLARPVNPCRSR